MYEQVIRVIAVMVTLAMGVLISSALAFGGAIIAVPVIGIMSILIVLDTLLARKKEEAVLGQDAWRQIPDRPKLELVTEGYQAPAIITHRSSTEIVFANSKAQEMLGLVLVGRTVDSEQDLPYKPIKMNGVKIGRDNHPAAILQRTDSLPMNTEVVYSTPVGDLSFNFRVRELLSATHKSSEFLLVTLYPKSEEQALRAIG